VTVGAELSDRVPDQLPARLCPSARCEPGALLLGIVGSNGRVGMIVPPLPIDAAFVDQAAMGRMPEKRFRFAGRCVEGDCLYWTGDRCGVIETALTVLDDQARSEASHPLRACGIRHACRWFSQQGRNACSVCPLIVTEVPHEGA
jgi:hypothetical protein